MRGTILDTLKHSQRSPEEMAEALSVLDDLDDARRRFENEGQTDLIVRVDTAAARILKAAEGVRDARSGMACDLMLDLLRLAYDDARAINAER